MTTSATDLSDTLPDELSPAVVTVTGPDRPGVSAAFFHVLSTYGVQLLDIEQSLFRGGLSSPRSSAAPPTTSPH